MQEYGKLANKIYIETSKDVGTVRCLMRHWLYGKVEDSTVDCDAIFRHILSYITFGNK